MCTMTSAPHSHIPYGESGSGHFGNWFCDQSSGIIAVVKDQIFKVIDSIPAHNGIFTIGDYGAADGCVSMSILRDFINLLRKKRGEIPIQIIYEDQASNDFNSLFKRVHGLIPDPPTYLGDFGQVFAMASGTSFYEQVMPDNTADLILSFLAVQWLSDTSTKFQNSLHRFPDASEAERKLVTAQAAKDWEKFLVLRAKELKSGGVLVVSTPCEDPEMKLNGVRHSTQNFQELMLKMWRRMRDEGRITSEEFVNTNLYACYRYLEELRAPFEDRNSAVCKAGLKLISAQQVVVPSSDQRKWQETLDAEGTDDRKTFAKKEVNKHRCWSNSSFIRGLSSTRSQSEKEALVDEFYSRVEAEMATQDPRECNNDYLVAFVFAQKV